MSESNAIRLLLDEGIREQQQLITEQIEHSSRRKSTFGVISVAAVALAVGLAAVAATVMTSPALMLGSAITAGALGAAGLFSALTSYSAGLEEERARTGKESLKDVAAMAHSPDLVPALVQSAPALGGELRHRAGKTWVQVVQDRGHSTGIGRIS